MNDNNEINEKSPIVLGVGSFSLGPRLLFGESNPYKYMVLKTPLQDRIEAVVSNGLGVNRQFRYAINSVDEMVDVDAHLLKMDNDSIAASVKFPDMVEAPPRFIEDSEGRERYANAPLSRFFMNPSFKPDGLDFFGTYSDKSTKYLGQEKLEGIKVVPKKFIGE